MGDHDWTTATMSTGCAFAEDPDNTDEVVLTNGLEECGMELSFTDTSIVYTVSEHISLIYLILKCDENGSFA